MLVSVIIPSFNQGRFLRAALDSVLEQAQRPLEIIVVDGASSDDSIDILHEYALRHGELQWISEPDHGPADAINKGLRVAQGEIIGILSSDDIYCEETLSHVVRFFSENADIGFAYGDVQAVGANDQLLGATCHPPFSWEAMFGIALCLPQGSIFFRASVARSVGLWNGTYYSCDLDYWLRAMMKTRVAKIPRILSLWRVHDQQRTQRHNLVRILRDYRRMIADSEELRYAPHRIRRLALASRDIMGLAFDTEAGPWRMRWYALAALLRHPTYWRYVSRPKLLHLIPFYPQLRWIFRRTAGGTHTA